MIGAESGAGAEEANFNPVAHQAVVDRDSQKEVDSEPGLGVERTKASPRVLEPGAQFVINDRDAAEDLEALDRKAEVMGEFTLERFERGGPIHGRFEEDGEIRSRNRGWRCARSKGGSRAQESRPPAGRGGRLR